MIGVWQKAIFGYCDLRNNIHGKILAGTKIFYLSDKKILSVSLTAIIIDDDPFARDDLRYMLVAHSDVAVVGEAGSAGEAVELLKRHSANIVFLDIQLRGGSGFDLVSHIRPSTAVFFVTAFGMNDKRLEQVPPQNILQKPVNPERLKIRLDHLRRHQK